MVPQYLYDATVRRPFDSPLCLGDNGASMLVCNAPDADFSLPFYADTVADLARNGTPAHRVAISDYIHRAPPGEAVGFVFHVARCGSTLLARSLELTGDLLVLREPGPFNEVFSPPRSVAPRRQILAASMGWFAALAADYDRQLAVKLPSMAATIAGEVCDAFPRIPALALLRHPHRVVESMLRDPADSLSWVLSSEGTAKFARQLARSPSGSDEPLARWAAVWACMVEELAPLIEHGKVTPLLYSEVAADPTSTVRSILSTWIGGTVSLESEAAITDAARRNAKRPERAFDIVAYRNASRLDAADRAVVDAIVAPAVDRLAQAGVELDDE